MDSDIGKAPSAVCIALI